MAAPSYLINAPQTDITHSRWARCFRPVRLLRTTIRTQRRKMRQTPRMVYPASGGLVSFSGTAFQGFGDRGKVAGRAGRARTGRLGAAWWYSRGPDRDVSGKLRPGTARADGQRGSHDQTGQRVHARRGSRRRPPHTTRDPEDRSTHRGDASPCIVYSTPGANPYNQRKLERRAVLQTNRMPAFVALARNAVLSANLRPNVQPVDDKADVKTAEVLSTLIRNTEHLSQVEAVYTTAIDAMAENGRGYVQVVTEYADDDTFNQRPRLKRVLNPFRVRVDPSAEEPDQRDAEYAFLETDYDADTWKEEFGGPGKELPTRDGTAWTGSDSAYRANWFPSDKKVRVMDWYCAEYTDETLYELHNGQTATGMEELDDLLMETIDSSAVDRERSVERRSQTADR